MELRKYALRVEALEARLALPLPEEVAKLVAVLRDSIEVIRFKPMLSAADALTALARRNAELERARAAALTELEAIQDSEEQMGCGDIGHLIEAIILLGAKP